MPIYAHVAGTIITQVGVLPRIWNDGTRDWDFRPADLPPAFLASLGWHPITTTTRPADTATTTSDPAPVALVDGVPTQQWTVRLWTAEELAAQAETAAWEAQQAADRAAFDALATTASAAHTDGEPWQQPAGAHDAYPLAATVTHGGKTWESLIPFNVWAPGVSGWRERVAEGYPAWAQPTGGHDAYAKGARVSFEGSDYESVIDNNVWSPTGYPQGWRKL